MNVNWAPKSTHVATVIPKANKDYVKETVKKLRTITIEPVDISVRDHSTLPRKVYLTVSHTLK